MAKLISPGVIVTVVEVDAIPTTVATVTSNRTSIISPTIPPPPPVRDWILANGLWNDSGYWFDTESWVD